MQCKLQWHKDAAYHRFKWLTVQEVCGVPSLIRLKWCIYYVSIVSHVVLSWWAGFPPAHIFFVVIGKFIENYIIKISEGKCNFNEKKNNYAGNFVEKHVLLWYEIDIYRKERKLIFIESLSFNFLAFFICRKCDTPNVNFYLPIKKRFL